MITIPHPLRSKVFQEYFVLESLVGDLPNLYKDLAEKIEAQANKEAEAMAGGDNEIYQTVFHSFDSSIEFAYSVPDQSRGYILAAIYAFYERNVQLVFKELGILEYQKEKMDIRNVFEKCNLPISNHRQIYEDIEMLGLIRNNLSHGKLNSVKNWEKLRAYVKKSPYLDLDDDIVRINDNYLLMNFIAQVISFFKEVFNANPVFASTHR